MQTKILMGLFVCHWLADYTHLSTGWMLKAKQFGKPLFPIFTHATVHALLMFVVLLCYVSDIVLVVKLSAFQLLTHFIIDVCKGRLNGWFPVLQSPENKSYWIVFGADQLLHAIVIVTMSAYAVV